MEPIVFIFVICIVMGSLVGILAGLLGIGGGLIMVPALVYLFVNSLKLDLSLAMPMAIATSLSTIILTGLSASWAHYKLNNLNRFVLLWSGMGIAAGSILGAQLASIMPGEVLKDVFAYLVIIIALQMVFGGRRESVHKMSKTILVFVGLATGSMSALMGIGGGSIIVPALVWFKVNIKQAIGCASFCGLIIALFGSASFIQAGWGNTMLPAGAFGYVYLPASLGIVITSVFTAGLGAKMGARLNTHLLKQIFAGFLVLVSLRMIVG
ncbi:MAG: putative membrane protein YfcA [Paraglaciecola sp.]